MIFMRDTGSSGGASQASVDAIAAQVAALLAAAAPALTYATGTLTPADSIIIPAVVGQVITVYGFILWGVGARKLASTDADGFSNPSYYHADDLIFTDDGLGGVRSSVLPMSPSEQPLYATPTDKAFAAIGDGNVGFMIWFTQE